MKLDSHTKPAGGDTKHLKKMVFLEDTSTTATTLSGSFINNDDDSLGGKKPRLDFLPRGLYGRSKETTALVKCFEDAQTSRQIVFIAGESGSGKSALAQWLKEHASPEDSIFVAGKYTNSQQEEPYTAFHHICQRICSDLSELSSAERSVTSTPEQNGDWCTDRKTVVNKLRQELGSQAQILLRLVPMLSSVLDTEVCHGDILDSTPESTRLRMDERNQLHIAFRTFFRVLSEFKRFVMVLDDLQWADQASLELFDYLAKDMDNHSLMIIASYRSDEVDEIHPFSKIMRGLKSYAEEEDDALCVSSISVGNLDIDSLNELVQAVLWSSDSTVTLPLAQIVHSRTLGNAFFSLLFLKSLAEDGLIELDETGTRYAWNIEQVKLSNLATHDAIELMQAKLQKLPDSVKSLIRLASVLGTTVDTGLLKLLVADFQSNPKAYCADTSVLSPIQRETEVTMEEVLSVMVDEGLMYRSRKTSYRWVHDKILEAATLPKAVRNKVYLRAGEMFQTRLSPEQMDQHLFIVVRLLNGGSSLIPTTNSEKRLNIAELNLKAGKASIENSGFASARSYFSRGISMLPSNHGRVHKTLSVDLFSSAAESEYCVGDVTRMEQHCRNVIARPHIPLEDKRRAYTVLIDGLNGQGKCAEAVELSIELLKKIGCTVPTKYLLPRILAGIVEMKAVQKRGIGAELDKIPPMSDPLKLWAMDILADLFKYAYLADMPNLVAVVLFKSFRWSIKYGRSPKVSMFLAQVGMLGASIGEYRVGKAYVKQSLAELQTHSTEKLICDVYTLIYTLAWHWTDDVDTAMLAKGHAAGIAAGVTENASWNMEHSLKHRIFTGDVLASVRDDGIRFSRQMKEFKVQKPHDLTVFGLQATLNLIGESNSTSKLSGSMMNSDTSLKEYAERNDNLSIAVMRLFQFYLAFLFDDHELVFEIRDQQREKDIEKSVPGQFGLCIMYYCNAMAALSLYRAKGGMKYKRAAGSLAKKVFGWARDGNPNVVHHAMMLEAEYADLQCKPIEAVRHFESAILRARDRGLLNDAAKGEQRFAEFWQRQGNEQKAEEHLRISLDLYEEWGARALSDEIRDRFWSLLRPTHNISCDVSICVSSSADLD